MKRIQKERVIALYALGILAIRIVIVRDARFRNDWSSTLPKRDNSFLYPFGFQQYLVE